jgi:hypothetical protein
MNPPTLEGIIERRLLINYRADPEVVAGMVPPPFRPQLVAGQAVVGICLLRLGELRPLGFPRFVGQRSENAAHRIAVEWDTDDGVAQGVYIERRDSHSMLNVAAGGRIFPGRHYRSHFSVYESGFDYSVGFHSADGLVAAQVEAHLSPTLTGSHLFPDLASASDFFRAGSIGYSDGGSGHRLDGMALDTDRWQIEPLTVELATSTCFDADGRFPQGSVALDCGLIMRNVAVRWRSVGPMVTKREQTSVA